MDVATSCVRRTMAPLFQHAWIRDFLLPASHDAYLDQLRYAVSNAEVCTASLSIVTHPTTTTAHTLDEKARLLVLPCFGTRRHTLGFIVRESSQVDTLPNEIPSCSSVPVTVSRFARDEESGTILTVLEQGAVTEIAYYSNIGPGYREHGFLTFATAAFRAAMDSDWEEASVLACVRHCLFSVELRSCPLCGAEQAGFCGCTFRRSPKIHPQDEKGQMCGVARFAGDYQGLATLAMFDGGQTVFEASYGSVVNASLTFDFETRGRLSAWALEDAATGKRINVMKLSVPAYSIHEDEGNETGENDDILDIAEGNPVNIGVDAVWEALREVFCSPEKVEKQSECQSLLPEASRSAPEDYAPIGKHDLSQQEKTEKSFFAPRKLVPLAPAHTTGREVALYVSERRRIEEKRRARNRKSAQRSNDKRRLALQKLKDDLAEAGEQERILRRRDKDLREENLALRNVASMLLS